MNVLTLRRSAPISMLAALALAGPAHAATPIDLATPGAGPAVAADASGGTHYAYLAGAPGAMHVEARIIRRGETTAEPIVLSRAEDDLGTPSIAATGPQTHVAWTDAHANGEVLLARVIGHDGTLSRPLVLADSVASITGVAAAADRSGRVRYVWRESLGGVFVVRTRTLSDDGSLSDAVTLSDLDDDAITSQLAVAADGEAYVSWTRVAGADRDAFAVAIAPDGTPGRRFRLNRAAGSTDFSRVAVDPAGGARFVWRTVGSGTPTVQTRTFADLTVTDVSPPGRDAFDPQLAIDPRGNAHVAWTQRGEHSVATVRTLPNGGAFGDVVAVSPADADVDDARITVDQSGRVYVAWTQIVAGRETAFLSRPGGSAQDLSPATDGVEDLALAGNPAAGAAVAFQTDAGAQGAIELPAGSSAPVPTATPAPTVAAPAPTTTPSPQPTAAPPAADRTAPVISRLRIRPGRISLRLSEPATLVVRLDGTRVTRAGRTGANSLRLRRLAQRGRHTVTVSAVDAAGNRSARARQRLRVAAG